MRQTGSVLWGSTGGLFGGAGVGVAPDTARSHSSFIAGPRWSAREDELDPLTAPGNMSPVDREFPSEPNSAQTGYSAPFEAYAAGLGFDSPRKATPPTTPTDWVNSRAGDASVAAPPATLASPHRTSDAAPAGLLAALFGHDGSRAEDEEALRGGGRQDDASEEGDGVGRARTPTNGSEWTTAYGSPRRYNSVQYDSPTRGKTAAFSPTQPLRWTRQSPTPEPTTAPLTPDDPRDGTLDPHREAWMWASADNRVSEMGLVRTTAKRGSLVDRRFNTNRSGRSMDTEASVYSDGVAGSSRSQSSRGGTSNMSELFYTTPHWTGTRVDEPGAGGGAPAAKPRKLRLPSLPSTSASPFVSPTSAPTFPMMLPPSPPQSFESTKRSDSPGGGTIDRIAASFASALTGLGRPLRNRESSYQQESLLDHGSQVSHEAEYPDANQALLWTQPGTPPAGLALNGPARGGHRSPHGGLVLPPMVPMASPASTRGSLPGLGHGKYRTPWMRTGDGAVEGWAGLAARQGPVSPPRPPKSHLRNQHGSAAQGQPTPPKGRMPLPYSFGTATKSPPQSSPDWRPTPSPLFADYTSYFAREAPNLGDPTEPPFIPPCPGQASDELDSASFLGSPPDNGRMANSPPALPLPPPPAPGKRWTIRRGTLGGDSDDGLQPVPPMWRTHAGTGSSEGGSRNHSLSSEAWQTDGSSAVGSWGSGGLEGGDDIGWEEVDVGVPVARG